MSSDPLDSFASRLRSERLRLGLSQLELAAALGLPPATYRNYEAGRTEPQVSVMQRLDEIGANLFWMVTGRLAPRTPGGGPSDLEQIVECGLIIQEWASRNPKMATKDIQDVFMRLACALVADGRGGDVAKAVRSALREAA
jgi:transcriptional regulator with XRE-family HTH domain